MANSIHRDINGPDWPLGLITVAAAGTPVGVMSVLDAAAGSETESSIFDPEFTPRCQQLIFQAVKSTAPFVPNVGVVYILRKPAAGGTGNRTDTGTIVKILAASETFILADPALTGNALSPYRYLIDADNAGDGCIVTAFVAG
jgi:hypothetical protein